MTPQAASSQSSPEPKPAAASAGSATTAADDAAAGAASASATQRGRDFRLFWLGGAANLLGSNATALVLPILVLSVGGTALMAGLVGTASAIVEVVVTPICGVYADRGSRRTMMLIALIVAALAMGAIAFAVGTHNVSLPLLFVCVMVGGAATATYGAAATASIRALLPPQEPEKAISSLQAREQAAKLAGPAVGGGLYQLASWVPFLADAVSFVFAAVCVRAIRADLRPQSAHPAATPTAAPATAGSTEATPAPTPAPTPPPTQRPSWRREFAAGLGFLWRQSFLRFVTLWAGGVNLVVGALGFAVIVSARLHGASSGEIGLVLTFAGVAGLAGALLAPFILRRVRAAVVVVVASWVMAAAVIPIVAHAALWTDGLTLVLISLLAPSLSIIFQSKAIMITPNVMQGRVGTALGTLGEGTGALAPLLAGVLVERLQQGPWALIFAAALAVLAGYATVNTSALRPAPAAEETSRPHPAPIPAER